MPQTRQNWCRITWRLKVYSVSTASPRRSVKASRGAKASTDPRRRQREQLQAIVSARSTSTSKATAAALAGPAVLLDGHSSGPMIAARNPVDHARAAERDQPHLARLARLEPDRGAGGDVEPHPARRRAVEVERRVGLGEMIVRADLHRPVAGVGDGQRDRLAVGVQRDLAGGGKELAGDHRSPSPQVRPGSRGKPCSGIAAPFANGGASLASISLKGRGSPATAAPRRRR